MEEGDNALLNSALANNLFESVRTGGKGCMTVSGTEVVGERGDTALYAAHEGGLNVFDSEFSGHGLDGVTLENVDLCALFDGVVVKANFNHGFNVLAVGALDIRNSRIIGNSGDGIHSEQPDLQLIVSDTEIWANGDDGFEETENESDNLDFYGFVSVVGNGAFGIKLQPSGPIAFLDIWCVLLAFGNGLEGLDIIDTTFTLDDEAILEACSNEVENVNGLDIDIANGIKNVFGEAICARVAGITCVDNCTDPGEALMCV